MILYFVSNLFVSFATNVLKREDDVMLGECLGGALYIEDFKRICHKARGKYLAQGSV